jgi:hypothetical protein
VASLSFLVGSYLATREAVSEAFFFIEMKVAPIRQF